MTPLTIAIDYDETFTADPELWGYFINKAQILSHKVVCVSARFNTESDLQETRSALPRGIQICLSGIVPKCEFMDDEGIPIDIWIDDSPDSITGKTAAIKAANARL